MKLKGFSLSGFDASENELHEGIKKCENLCYRRYGYGMEILFNEFL